ncbi:MAG TPA: hypothetical protein VMN99_14475 [Anaerolineales bacterium]|nr:hypothetical protein [Anaerolineales bacterium]
MAEEIVVFDIDGTLADVSERPHHLNKKPKDRVSFYKGIPQDKAIQSMVRYVTFSMRQGSIFFYTPGEANNIGQRRSSG